MSTQQPLKPPGVERPVAVRPVPTPPAAPGAPQRPPQSPGQPPAQPPQRQPKIRVGDLLIQEGLVTQEQLQIALARGQSTGKRLGQVVIELQMVTEEDVAKAIAKQMRIAFVDLRDVSLKPELVARIPESTARRLKAILLTENEQAIEVGLVDPTEHSALDELRVLLRKRVTQCVVTESAFEAQLARLYRRTEEVAGLARDLRNELSGAAVSEGADANNMTDGGKADEAIVGKLLTTMMGDAVRLRASDVHIEPQSQTSARVRYRIDGELVSQHELDMVTLNAIVIRLKLFGNLDISEKRLPQDGRFKFTAPGIEVDIRMSTLPAQYGESVVMRLLPQITRAIGLNTIGLPADLKRILAARLHSENGMILVTGPTGSGKTSTLFGALSSINAPNRKIITVEDPIEIRLPGLNQTQVNDKIGLTFAAVLRAVLRQDPDVVLVGEMRDQETAEIGMRAALTGHLVMSTLHTNDAPETPIRLLNMGVPGYLVAASLHLVIAQRLVRMLCERCAQPAVLTPHQETWANMLLERAPAPADERHQVLRPVGCNHCNTTGYDGRSAVFEYLQMTEGLVDALNREDTSAFAKLARAHMAGRTLGRDALRLALQGRTSIDEAMRVSNDIAD